MSISHSLSNALSGLTAASRMAEVVSSNLANALTDGYGRRRLDLSAATIGGRGAGVDINGVTRIVDRGILADRRLADAGLSGHAQTSDFLSRVEGLIGTAGAPDSLSNRVNNVEQALIDASAAPPSDTHLQGVVDRFNQLAGSLNAASDGVQGLRIDADKAIAQHVETLNTSLRQVEQLNADITMSFNTGNDPSALIDQRQRTIDTIAEIVPIREVDRQGGQVALMTTSGESLIDGPAKQFGFAATNFATAEMTLASGGLSGITLGGQALSPTDGVGKLAGGALGAAFSMRDIALTDVQSGLDAMARDLIERFQDPAVDPTLAVGAAGLLTDDGTAFDPLNAIGLAGRISVNAAVDPAKGGALSRLRDGVDALAAGPIGASQQLDAWSDALSDVRSISLGGQLASSSGHAANLMSKIGSARLASDSEVSFATARWDTLRQAELSNGVDSDYELQMLLQIEQAYAANAKLVQTVESMIQTLMEL
ncbi:MAG: flagellar hook-associated protein 1 FlgK [Paracoccaceae bacterium]|jgi:flagellar hook-associated protein 1 FlgK